MNNKYQNEIKLLQDITDIYKAYKYALSVVSLNERNEAANYISQFKTNYSCFLWLISYSRLFLIGYLFRFMVWVMLKRSRNLKSSYNQYSNFCTTINNLSQNNIKSRSEDIISKDEFNHLCKKYLTLKKKMKSIPQIKILF